MEQTAVEWLYIELIKTWYDIKSSQDLLEQAKAMEKKQIEVAFSDGQNIPINSPTLPMYSREEYYNDTYGKE
jgi:hypothetical protein